MASCQHFSLGKSCPSSAHPEASLFLPLCSWLFWAQSFPVSPCVGPLRELPGTPKAHCVSQLQSLLVFTSQSYKDFSSWQWNPRLKFTEFQLSFIRFNLPIIVGYVFLPFFFLIQKKTYLDTNHISFICNLISFSVIASF